MVATARAAVTLVTWAWPRLTRKTSETTPQERRQHHDRERPGGEPIEDVRGVLSENEDPGTGHHTGDDGGAQTAATEVVDHVGVAHPGGIDDQGD